MALRSEAAVAAALGSQYSCTSAPVSAKGDARTISCKPLSIACSMSWSGGGEDETSPVSYGSLGRESAWLSENYLGLRLRSSPLIASEVSGALRRHFESRDSVGQVSGKEDVQDGVPAGWMSLEQFELPEVLQSSFQDAAISDMEILLRSHLYRVAAPRGSFLDESWC